MTRLQFRRFSLSPPPIWQPLSSTWGNLNLRLKLTLLLVFMVGLPTVAVTQALITVERAHAWKESQESLRKDALVFTEEYVLWTQGASENQAAALAQRLEAARIDLNNPEQIAAEQGLLGKFITLVNTDSAWNKSFQILTNLQGRGVAQAIQVLDQDLGAAPPLPRPTSTAPPQYRPVQLSREPNLARLPIVQRALATGRPLSGMEILNRRQLQELGLDKIAHIGVRSPATAPKAPEDRPVAAGTYPLEAGTLGLVGLAVHPVKLDNQLVGTVVVGILLNRNYGIIDEFSSFYKVPAVGIYAWDWSIATNIPDLEHPTRAIGSRIPSPVAIAVLDQGRDFFGPLRGLTTPLVAAARPLYDHQKQLNPTQAKPIGMVLVGHPLAKVESSARNQQLIAYSIGGGILLLAVLIALAVAASLSSPLQYLALFAQKIGAEDQKIPPEPNQRGTHLEKLAQMMAKMVKRSDEIGAVARAFDKVANSVYHREQNYKQQLQQLLAEADQAKQTALDSQLGKTAALQKLLQRSRETRLQTEYAKINLAQVLAQIPYFQTLTAADLQALSDRGSRTTVATGAIICREAEPGTAFYILLAGSVEVVIEKLQLKLQTLSAVGSFFGEMALLLGSPRTATVRAKEPSLLFVIQRQALQELLIQHQDLREEIAQKLSQRQTEIQQISQTYGPLKDEDVLAQNPLDWVRQRMAHLWN